MGHSGFLNDLYSLASLANIQYEREGASSFIIKTDFRGYEKISVEHFLRVSLQTTAISTCFPKAAL